MDSFAQEATDILEQRALEFKSSMVRVLARDENPGKALRSMTALLCDWLHATHTDAEGKVVREELREKMKDEEVFRFMAECAAHGLGRMILPLGVELDEEDETDAK